jgi:hypothetical protein
MGVSTVKWIGGGGNVTASQSGGRRRGWKGWSGPPELSEGHRGGTLPREWL